MNAWILFVLFLFVGLGMLIAGILYERKEKDDPESVKIYRAIAIIGAVLSIGATLLKFMR
ncbi:MAG: hypothetical protein AAGU32_05115 [Bacillota bacterium]